MASQLAITHLYNAFNGLSLSNMSPINEQGEDPTDESKMTRAEVEAWLEIDDNKADALCAVPPKSGLLGPKDSKFHAAKTSTYNADPEKPEYNGKYPVYEWNDVNELHKVSSFRDPNKKRLWVPYPDRMVDGHGNIVRTTENQAHINHATRFFNEQAQGFRQTHRSDEEQSWTHRQMAMRLEERGPTHDYAQKMRRVLDREKKAERLEIEEAANILLSIAASNEVFSPPSAEEEAIESMVKSARPSKNQMSLAQFEERLRNGQNAVKNNTTPADRNQIVSLLPSNDRPSNVTKARPFPVQTGLEYPFEEEDDEDFTPIRRIARRKEDRYERVNPPAWAKRKTRGGEILPPSAETQNTQRKLLEEQIRWRNSEASRPLDAGLEQVDHLMTAAWEVGTNEEYDLIQSEPNTLAKIFDEPDHPIGAFDPAEVEYYNELDRQTIRKNWQKQGCPKEELNEFEMSVRHMNPADLDERGKAAREALIASRKLLVAPTRPQRLAPMRKRKQATVENEDEPTASGVAVRRSKRNKTAQPVQESLEVSDKAEDSSELSELSEESDEQEALQDNEETPRRTSQDSNGSSKKVTFTFGGKHIKTFTYNVPPGIGQNTIENQEQGDAMDLN